MKKGFTLIELLVVVLIIGILSSVALPQYTKAVTKARVSSMLALLKTLADSQELYHIANGQYASQITDLDVDLPANCVHIETNAYGDKWRCDEHFIVDNGYVSNTVNINYCPGKNSAWATCESARELQIAFRLKHNTFSGQANKRYCVGYSSLGKKICASFAGLEYRAG